MRKTNDLRRIWSLFLVALAVAPALALGQIYRWVDEKGVTHYGEKPGGKGARELNIPDPTGGAGTASEKPKPSREADLQRQEREFQRRHAERESQLEETRRAQARSTRSTDSRLSSCRRATRDLEVMRANPTQFTYDQERRVRDIAARDCR